jgi:hypothetical protein
MTVSHQLLQGRSSYLRESGESTRHDSWDRFGGKDFFLGFQNKVSLLASIGTFDEHMQTDAADVVGQMAAHMGRGGRGVRTSTQTHASLLCVSLYNTLARTPWSSCSCSWWHTSMGRLACHGEARMRPALTLCHTCTHALCSSTCYISSLFFFPRLLSLLASIGTFDEHMQTDAADVVGQMAAHMGERGVRTSTKTHASCLSRNKIAFFSSNYNSIASLSSNNRL